MEEIFDTYTREGKFLGTKPKSFCHSKEADCYHKAVCVFVMNSKGEILVQKRASTKRLHPNLWASSSAGHVVAGESVFETAQRETLEELGLNLKESEFSLLAEIILDYSLEFMNVFVAKNDAQISELTLQVEEVSEAKWITLDEFKKLINSDEFVPISDEFKNIVLDILNIN